MHPEGFLWGASSFGITGAGLTFNGSGDDTFVHSADWDSVIRLHSTWRMELDCHVEHLSGDYAGFNAFNAGEEGDSLSIYVEVLGGSNMRASVSGYGIGLSVDIAQSVDFNYAVIFDAGTLSATVNGTPLTGVTDFDSFNTINAVSLELVEKASEGLTPAISRIRIYSY